MSNFQIYNSLYGVNKDELASLSDSNQVGQPSELSLKKVGTIYKMNELLSYGLKRILQTIISIWVLATLTFFLLKIFPGSPYDDEISLHPSVQEQINKNYNLHLPISEQYGLFLKNLSQGNFGASQFFSGKRAVKLF